jgi:hypothetical protein
MRNAIITSMLGGIVALSLSAFAQDSQQPAWRPCPRCVLNSKNAEAVEKLKDHPFNPHDLSGVWGNNDLLLDTKTVPPMTAWGKQQYDATKADESAAGVAISNSKDGMLICDPLGYPRSLFVNDGFEFVMLPDRVLQFFEWSHTWRTIWTDGRKLLDDPPVARFHGYNIGHWEGDTFIVEANGFDERSWLSEDRRDRRWGFPHSDEMKLTERYKRTSYVALDVTVTVDDPKTYTKPWVTHGAIRLRPGTEISEYFCVPSESQEFNERILKPSVGAKPGK